MPSLLNNDERDAILARLRRMKPTTAGLWGTLTAPQMICHLCDAMRVALGEVKAVDRSTPLSRSLLKFLIIQTPVQPPPGKVKTAPEMLSSSPEAFAADLATCERLLARLGRGEARGTHPTFGPLSTAEWGKLGWKHMDHHLRQFGV